MCFSSDTELLLAQAEYADAQALLFQNPERRCWRVIAACSRQLASGYQMLEEAQAKAGGDPQRHAFESGAVMLVTKTL
jgi:hypothetical protein